MRTDSVYKNVKWVDLENPTSDEIREIVEEFEIAPIVANELMSPSIRSHVDVHSKFLYLILHFPYAHSPNSKELGIKKTQEVDFIIAKDFIITTHYDSIDALHDFSKVFEVQSILDKSDIANHGGFVFYYMAKHFYKQTLHKIETIQDLISETERKIFEGEEIKMVSEISKINRVLLSFRESISSHEEILKSFEIAANGLFGEKFKYHSNVILGEYYKVSTKITHIKDYLGELRNTNDSLLSTKQNEIMKNLTLMSFIFLPLSFVAGFFGMNVNFMIAIGPDYFLTKIVLSMIIIIIATFALFKTKKWF